MSNTACLETECSSLLITNKYKPMETNYIGVTILRSNWSRCRLTIYSEWTDGVEYFTIHDTGMSLVIRKCGLDIPKGALKCSGHQFDIVSDIPVGRHYFIIPEGDDREIVIDYLKNK